MYLELFILFKQITWDWMMIEITVQGSAYVLFTFDVARKNDNWTYSASNSFAPVEGFDEFCCGWYRCRPTLPVFYAYFMGIGASITPVPMK